MAQNGWKNREANTFYQGNTYHIPYVQPVTSGKYVYWGVSIDDYIASTQNAQSVFYTNTECIWVEYNYLYTFIVLQKY